MRILALETSSLRGSIAALTGTQVLCSQDLPLELRIAQSLAPTIRDVLRAVAWSPRNVELIAVTQGPGSFTGLRAGVTTAKVFAYAAGADVLGLNTLDVLAAQSNRPAPRLWAVVDAQRQQLFAALFAVGDAPLPQPIVLTQILDYDAWLALLQPGDVVTGSGLGKNQERLPHNVTTLPVELWEPQATTLGRLARARYQAGERQDFWKLTPDYFRKSAAEEQSDLRT